MSNTHYTDNAHDEPTLVDGGFLSWLYGSSVERDYVWQSQSYREFRAVTQRMIVMDSPQLLRTAHFPDYKSHRQEKADADPNWGAKVEAVRAFRGRLRRDSRLHIIELDGFEADDVLTAFALMYWKEFDRSQLPVIGMDKDLLQCSDFLNLSGYGASAEKDISFEAWREKQPKAIQPHLGHHSQILQVLALLGDKSDDIPRIIPPRRLDILVEILKHSSPWARAFELFGNDVKTNLYVTVLPGPWCFEELPTEEEVFERVNSYSYLSRELSPAIKQLFHKSVRASIFS